MISRLIDMFPQRPKKITRVAIGDPHLINCTVFLDGVNVSNKCVFADIKANAVLIASSPKHYDRFITYELRYGNVKINYSPYGDSDDWEARHLNDDFRLQDGVYKLVKRMEEPIARHLEACGLMYRSTNVEHGFILTRYGRRIRRQYRIENGIKDE